MEMKLELVTVPVTDVDRAILFYTEKIGFNLDYDHKVKEDLRFVQLTPKGSACSIALGVGLTDMAPGSQKGLQMVIKDAKAAHELLRKNGVDTSDVQVFPWGSFVFFQDPDGNKWALQQIPPK
jgi:catechol 2,3-dioxygenase-like lactoylglutathione lyase family enzyme